MEYKNYIYYASIDASKEPIDRVEAASIDIATDFFAERKQMETEIFKELYTVELYEIN